MLVTFLRAQTSFTDALRRKMNSLSLLLCPNIPHFIYIFIKWRDFTDKSSKTLSLSRSWGLKVLKRLRFSGSVLHHSAVEGRLREIILVEFHRLWGHYWGLTAPSVSRGFVASPRLSEGTGGPCAGAEPGLKQGLTVFPQPWPRVQRGNWTRVK